MKARIKETIGCGEVMNLAELTKTIKINLLKREQWNKFKKDDSCNIIFKDKKIKSKILYKNSHYLVFTDDGKNKTFTFSDFVTNCVDICTDK